MSALAIIALSQGYRVSGSDARAGAQLDAVREAGATCFVGHDARHVGGSDAHDDARDDEALTLVDPPDLVVVSSAVPGDNVEVAFARRVGIPVFSRAQWLARVTRGRAVAAVAGTHGKTSTSAALAVALRSAGLDVSAVVGGNVPQFPGGRNAVGGGDDVFVVEADEYDGAFLGLEPTTAVLLNVEHDHPDMFEDERAVIEMFARFLKRVKPGGTVVACGDDANVRALVATLAVRNDLPENRFTEDDVPENVRDPEAVSCVTFGFGAANAWRAVDLRADTRTGGCSFTVTHEGAFVSEMSVPGTGAYAALNALAAFVAADSVDPSSPFAAYHALLRRSPLDDAPAWWPRAQRETLLQVCLCKLSQACDCAKVATRASRVSEATRKDAEDAFEALVRVALVEHVRDRFQNPGRDDKKGSFDSPFDTSDAWDAFRRALAAVHSRAFNFGEGDVPVADASDASARTRSRDVPESSTDGAREALEREAAGSALVPLLDCANHHRRPRECAWRVSRAPDASPDASLRSTFP